MLIGPLLRFFIGQRFQLLLRKSCRTFDPVGICGNYYKPLALIGFSWGGRATIRCCFFLLLRLRMVPQTVSMGPLGFPLPLLTFATYLLKNINYLLGILFSRSHVPGKQPGSVQFASTITTMTSISVKLVVHRRENQLFQRSSRVQTCRPSTAVSRRLDPPRVASLIRSKNRPWRGSCQVSSPLFQPRRPYPLLPPRTSLNFSLARTGQAGPLCTHGRVIG